MRKGFEHEMEFWKDFVKTDRFRDNWQSDTRNPELSQHVVDLLQAESGLVGHNLKIRSAGIIQKLAAPAFCLRLERICPTTFSKQEVMTWRT